MPRTLLLLLSLLAAALAAALLPSLASAASRFAVTTTADTLDSRAGDGRCADRAGRCSLRAAIMEGNATRDGARVALRSARYRLTLAGAGEDGARSGDLDVTGAITIVGGGALIDAARVDRAFDVATSARLTIGRARIANGAPPAGQSGGAIESEGRVELKNVRVLKNAVQGDGASGGGIFNSRGTLIVRDSQVNRNGAPRAGGGIEALEGTTLLRRASLLVNATAGAPGNGGGLHLTGRGVVDVRDSTVDRNSATAEGGGLWNSVSGAMSVSDTTVTRNVAAGAAADEGGGGIFNDGGRLRVDRGTLALNQAGGAAGSGGGLLNNLGTVLLDGTDVNSNGAKRAGGGIEAVGGSTSVVNARLTGNATGAAPGNGGALHLTGAGSVAVSDGQVARNSASAEGG
ncbi:MAG TPA: hypothetical protein VLK58_03650, partial [Conexibacter sp.]|nr:hypothetical protein [Conexibacter sp.]